MCVAISSSSVAIKSSAESWLSMTTSRVVDHLRRMNGRRDRGLRVDQAKLAKDALLEIGEARALARPPAPPRDRDAADDAEIELRHVLEADRLAMLHEALRGGGGFEIDALGGEPLRVDPEIGKALGQIGHRREQKLAVVERPQPDRDLRRVGIALDDAGAFPCVEFAEPLCGDVRADEIRDAIERRSDIDPGLDEAAPDTVADGGLHAVASGPTGVAAVRHDRPSSRIARRARQRRRPARGRARRASARSSRQGGAMICTPIGSLSPSVQTGAATTGRPMKEMGWVKSPIFGRTSISLPSRTKVFWPSFGARHGVAGASRMSTSRKSASASSRKRRRNFCACTTHAPGSIAPAMSRSRTSGSKSAARVCRRSKVQRRAFDHGDEIGRRARPRGLGEFDDPVRLQRAGDRVDRGESGRLAEARKIAAEPGDAKPATPSLRASAKLARPERPPAPDRPGRVQASRRRRAQDRRLSERRAEMIEARDKRKGLRRATGGRRSA